MSQQENNPHAPLCWCAPATTVSTPLLSRSEGSTVAPPSPRKGQDLEESTSAMPRKPHHPNCEFYTGDAEMLSSFAPLSELAFEMEMEGAEPFVPEPALSQRRLNEAHAAHASSPLSSGTTSPISAKSRVRAAGTPRRTAATEDARSGASLFAQRDRSPGRTPMYQPIVTSMLHALHLRNERERHTRSIRARSPG